MSFAAHQGHRRINIWHQKRRHGPVSDTPPVSSPRREPKTEADTTFGDGFQIPDMEVRDAVALLRRHPRDDGRPLFERATHRALAGDFGDLGSEGGVDTALDPDDALEAVDLAAAPFCDLAAIGAVI